ncbi:hypothetical protein LJK87_43395 [Paenibacillus sp. P25]|nr:hypothetical protein LJK87_43395 [Paenibacillus sp. P25]
MPEQTNVNDKELDMAKMLIQRLSTPFEPEKYKDDYRETLLEAIGQKVSGKEVRVAPEPHRANVIDLMAALQASLEALKPVPSEPAPAAGKTKGTKGAKGKGKTKEPKESIGT